MPYWYLYLLFALVAFHLHKLAAILSAYRYCKAHGLHFARPLKQTETILGLALFRRLQQNAEDGISLQSHAKAPRPLARPKAGAQGAELSMFEEHVLNLLSRIPPVAGTVDLQRLFFNFTLDSVTHSLLGRPGSASGAGLPPGAGETGRIRILARNKAFEKDCRVVHTAVDGYVAGSSFEPKMHPDAGGEDSERGKYDLLSELAGTVSDHVQIRNELLNVLLAARDMMASLLSSVFFMLARHPSVWERLEREAQGRGQGPLPTLTQLRQMKYVRAVLDESAHLPLLIWQSLRAPPPLPSGSHEHSVRNAPYLPRGGGRDGRQPVFVAKGTIVHYSVWTIHRSTEIYGDDAEKFRPERWLQPDGGSGKESVRPGWGFLPFSAGPKVCLGQQKTLTEVTSVVVKVVRTFRNVEARDDRPWRELMGLVLSSYHGASVGLRARGEQGQRWR
ncbi:cytochrome P450 [Aspergillus navahoensis]